MGDIQINFFLALELKSWGSTGCGEWIGLDPGKILRRKDLEVKYCGIRG
jgi:hypothetical protein